MISPWRLTKTEQKKTRLKWKTPLVNPVKANPVIAVSVTSAGEESTIIDGPDQNGHNIPPLMVWTNPDNPKRKLPKPRGHIFQYIAEMDKPMRFDYNRYPSNGAEWVTNLCEMYYGIDTNETHKWLREEVRYCSKECFEEIYYHRIYLINGHRFRSCSRQLLMAILLFHDQGTKPAHEWILDSLLEFATSSLECQNVLISFARRANGCYTGIAGFRPYDLCYFRCGRLENEVPLRYFRKPPPQKEHTPLPYDDE